MKKKNLPTRRTKVADDPVRAEARAVERYDWARETVIRFNRNIKNGIESYLSEGRVKADMTLAEFLVVLEKRIKELEDGKKEQVQEKEEDNLDEG